MKVALVTTWGTSCGIASHSALLKVAVEHADPSIEVLPWTDLAPQSLKSPMQADLIWLNYQASLLSQWTPDWIRQWRAVGMRVGVTYHDTGVPNSAQCKAVVDAADAAVVHEPFDDLPVEKTHYWRMGVPDYDGRVGEWTRDHYVRPRVGTVGHDFPWKLWSELAVATHAVGWGLLICTPEMSEDREAVLRAWNPWLTVRRGLDQQTMLASLNACDATAALYVCHNTGQSGAILQCIGARKPVLAFSTCRQMRALWLDDLGERAIWWCETFDDVKGYLQTMELTRLNPMVVALAEQESWTLLGAKYAALYRELVA